MLAMDIFVQPSLHHRFFPQCLNLNALLSGHPCSLSYYGALGKREEVKKLTTL